MLIWKPSFLLSETYRVRRHSGGLVETGRTTQLTTGKLVRQSFGSDNVNFALQSPGFAKRAIGNLGVKLDDGGTLVSPYRTFHPN